MVGTENGQPASEKYTRSMADQIEKDLGKEARRDFHDAKQGPDRTPQQLKEDAANIYRDYGKEDKLPSWMTPQ